MSQNVANWFQQVWNSEVKLAYQQTEAKLRNTVRTKTDVKGETTHFPRAGTMEVGDKERGGLVPVSNPDMDKASCTLSAKYGGAWVDDLDEIQNNSDERGVHVKNAAGAHGRNTDGLIIAAAMTATTHIVGDFTTGLTQGLIQYSFEKLNNANVPDDGDRVALVTPHAWEELLKIDAFAKADFIGTEKLPWLGGNEAKRWRNTLWMPHTGLTINGVQASNIIYHKTAIGHAIGRDLKTEWSWENTRSAWFLNTNMFQGACLIDGKGVVLLRTKNDTAL
jgi:hypothetical protein